MFLTRHLNYKGLLVFTTHGAYVSQRLRTRDKLYGLGGGCIDSVLARFDVCGFSFEPYPGVADYGISVVLPSVVAGQIESIPEMRLISFDERGWLQHQDVYACQKFGNGGI